LVAAHGVATARFGHRGVWIHKRPRGKGAINRRILGAVLWTGYLGGAIATHVRVGNPLFTHILFPIYVAALLWGGLWLRDRRLRGVFAPLND